MAVAFKHFEVHNGHGLTVDRTLAPGAREKRQWSCVCHQWSVKDYDAGAVRSFKAHKENQV